MQNNLKLNLKKKLQNLDVKFCCDLPHSLQQQERGIHHQY